MNQGRGSGCLLALILLLLIFMSSPEAACADMLSGYPTRFRFYGVIELDYINYSSEVSGHGRKTRATWSTLEQRYNLNVEGYIYHPRLAVFSAGVTYDKDKGIKGNTTDSRDIGYNVSATFLPYRPISLDVYAMKDYYTFSSSNISSQDSSSDQYGARLRIHTKILPAIDLEYYHSDYGSGGSKTENNAYSISVQGGIKPLRTLYGLGYTLSDLSGSGTHSTDKFFRAYTTTTIRTATLATSFVRTSQDFYKLTGFSASLEFVPTRFYHYYSYDYTSSQSIVLGSEAAGTGTVTTKTTIQLLRGSWSYRLTDRLLSSLGINYSINKQDKQSWKSYGIVPSLDYRKSFAGFELSSHYMLFLRNDELRGNLTEHSLDLGLRTLKFKAGTLYADYVFIRSSETIKPVSLEGTDLLGNVTTGVTKALNIDTTVNLFRLGLRGRGLKFISRRITWELEGEYLNSVSNGQKLGICNTTECILLGNEETVIPIDYSQNTSQYNFYGNAVYPIGRGATVSSRAGYAFGTSASKSLKKLFYDFRLNYPVSRKILVSAWWQEIRNKIEGSPDTTDRNYEVYVTYRIGKTFFSLRYQVQNTEESDVTTHNTRILASVRRFF